MNECGVLFRKVLLRMYRVVLRFTTVLRCPAVLGDPTALVSRLWPQQIWPADPDPDSEWDAEGASRSTAGSQRGPTRLLVIVPFRDKWPLTQAALDSLVGQRGHGLSVEVALVDNGSAEDTVMHVSQWLERHRAAAGMRFRLLRYDIPFNFSKLNNLAYAACTADQKPDYLLLLNNDVVLTDSHTLRRFVLRSRVLGPRMGAMGCTLLYRDGRVQHSFVAPGVVLVGAHPLKRVPFRPHYAWFQGTQRVPAITGALFWLPAGVFAQVGGFDEGLPTAYQDVDLCLKITTSGYQIFSIADLTAIHDESATRTALPSLEEAEHIYRKWGPALTAHPEVPRELSRWSEHPTLRFIESEFPWRWLYQ